VRLRRAPELAPGNVIRRQRAWHEHYVATVDTVREVGLEDLASAGGIALGTASLFGLPSAQLKAFIDQTRPLWVTGGVPFAGREHATHAHGNIAHAVGSHGTGHFPRFGGGGHGEAKTERARRSPMWIEASSRSRL
jgi:multimeric flavodoxin WrbA